MSAAFRAFRQLNDPRLARLARLRKRFDRKALARLLEPADPPSLTDRLVIELAERGALPIKELFESFEFFERVRRRTRAPAVADLCCGHGLTGILFAVFSRPVQRVLLLDQRRPKSHDKVLAAATAAAPWIEGRVRFVEVPLKRASEHLEPGCSLVAVHACGVRTDRCIDLAISRRAALAVMPCCYFGTGRKAPRALRKAFGAELATDIDRTYRLQQAGFEVDWTEVPKAITAMNRVLVALPR